MINKVTFAELIKSYAEKNELTHKQAEQVVRSLFSFVVDDLDKKGKANITNFGSFELKRVAARMGINPQNGEEIVIPAHNKVAFKPYKALEEHVNQQFADLEPELLDEEAESTTKKSSSEPTVEPRFTPSFDNEIEEEQTNVEKPTSPVPSNYIDEVLPSDTDEHIEQDPFGINSSPTEDVEKTETPPVFYATDSFQAEDKEPDEEISDNDDVDDVENKPPFFELDLPDLGDFDDDVTPTSEESEPTVVVRTNIKNSVSDDENTNEGKNSNEPEEELTIDKKPITKEKKAKKEENPIITWLLLFILIAVVAGGIWYFFFRSNTSTHTEVAKTTIQNNEVSPIINSQEADIVEFNENEVSNNTANKPTEVDNQITETEETAKEIVSSNESSSINSYVIKKDEWMWDISRTVYGKPALWPLIFESNRTI